MSKIIPLFDRILVSRIKAAQKTASGILIPEKAQETLNQGKVIAVGAGKDGKPLTIKKGDLVLLPAYGGSSVKMENQEYLLFKEEEILAKLE